MRAIVKGTAILIGMIVIVSLGAPALAGGGDGSDGQPQDPTARPERIPDDVLRLILSLGLVNIYPEHGPAPDAPPSEGLPTAPPGPPDPDDSPDGGEGGEQPSSVDPREFVPCDVDLPESDRCGRQPEAPEEPETPEAPAPAPPQPPEQQLPAPPTVEDVQAEVTAAQQAVVDRKAHSEGLLATFFAPVQAAAKSAADGAVIVITGVLTTADVIAEDTQARAARGTGQLIGVVNGAFAFLQDLLEDILEEEAPQGAHDQQATLETQGAQTGAIERPIGLVTLGLVAMGGLGLIALAFVGTRKLLGLGGLALLSRIPSKDIMKSDTRAAIFQIVQNDPGVSLNEIVDRLGLSRNAVAYHLAVFESEKTVVSVKDGKYRRYFVNGGKYVNGAKDVVSTIKNEVTRNVIRFILEHPGAMQKEVCTAVGTSPSATNWHINRLEKVGLVEKAKVANTVRYSPGPSVEKYDLHEFGLAPQPLSA